MRNYLALLFLILLLLPMRGMAQGTPAPVPLGPVLHVLAAALF